LMVFGAVGLFTWQLSNGMPLADVRNGLLLQFILFENVLTLCARSERTSLFGPNFFRNPLLLGGIVFTQLLHIAVMYVPAMSGTLQIKPIALSEWAVLLAPALLLMAALELDKLLARRRAVKRPPMP
jgi:cation-transporting ATPase F